MMVVGIKYKYTYIFLFQLIPLITFCQVNNNQIIWSIDYKLKWSDFRIKDSMDHLKHDIAAETNYRIDCGKIHGEDDTLIYQVCTLFLKNESFCDLKYLKSDTVFMRKALMHEQIHFDIAEVFARKLRKDIINRLNTFKHKNSDKVVQIIAKLYDKEVLDCIKLQDSFDEETAIGSAEREALRRNSYLSSADKMQMEKNLLLWREKIDAKLQELDHYSNTKIKIKVKKITAM